MVVGSSSAFERFIFIMGCLDEGICVRVSILLEDTDKKLLVFLIDGPPPGDMKRDGCCDIEVLC